MSVPIDIHSLATRCILLCDGEITGKAALPGAGTQVPLPQASWGSTSEITTGYTSNGRVTKSFVPGPLH